ncbi:Hypothetical predicted protein [Lecanosticta acicola]|uniref:Uncharacterized protein n=1 Tax=Lecanosticta acicola TaxID=111012 RepID=A0AAI8Z4U7_9PEZI|nr:Hypothetical predicted protein [Lecanosticta acicola]
MSSLFAGLFRRAPQTSAIASKFPFTAETNPYRCKRTWPPDFTHLSAKHQFRLERRYRRRSKLKWARPTWTKGVKLAQWGSIVFVLIYGVLFMQVDDGRTPFDGIRAWYNEQMGNTNSPNRPELPAGDNSPVSRRQPS